MSGDRLSSLARRVLKRRLHFNAEGAEASGEIREPEKAMAANLPRRASPISSAPSASMQARASRCRPPVLLCGIFLAAVWAHPCAASPTAFDEANHLFEQGDFSAARERYAQVAEGGERSANLFHNLGNAEYRLEARGRAALNYERALVLEPWHAEARKNLAFVRGQTAAKVLPRKWLDRALREQISGLYPALAAGALWVAIGCGTVGILRKRRRVLPCLAGTFALLVATYAGAGVWRDEERRAEAIIIVPEAAARSEAAENSRLAERLPAGSAVRVRARRGAFTYADLPSGQRGWIRSEELENVQPEKG